MVNFLECRMLSELIVRVNTMQLKSNQAFLQTVDESQAFITDVIDVARFPADASVDEQMNTFSKALEVTDLLCNEVPATTPKDAQLFTVLLPMSTTIRRYSLCKSSLPLRRVFSYIAGSGSTLPRRRSSSS